MHNHSDKWILTGFAKKALSFLSYYKQIKTHQELINDTKNQSEKKLTENMKNKP